MPVIERLCNLKIFPTKLPPGLYLSALKAKKLESAITQWMVTQNVYAMPLPFRAVSSMALEASCTFFNERYLSDYAFRYACSAQKVPIGTEGWKI